MTADLAAALDALFPDAADLPEAHPLVASAGTIAALVKVAKDYILFRNQCGLPENKALAALREQLANHEQEER